jgi:hypothetical protein
MGWHGQKRAWAIRKVTEIDALNETIRRLIEDGYPLEESNTKDF